MRQDDARAHDPAPDPGRQREHPLRRRDLLGASRRRAAPAAPRDAAGVPGPLLVARSPGHGGRQHRRGPAGPRRAGRRPAPPGRRGARPGRPRSVPRPAVPPRVQRRAAPAGRDRPRPGGRAPLPRGRRAGLGARRVDPLADPQPAGRPPAAPRPDHAVRGPRPERRRAPVRPGGGHVPRPHRRGRDPRRGVRRPRSTRTRGRSCRPCPCPTRPAGAGGRSPARRPAGWHPPEGCSLPPQLPHRRHRHLRRRGARRSAPRTGHPGHLASCHLRTGDHQDLDPETAVPT